MRAIDIKVLKNLEETVVRDRPLPNGQAQAILPYRGMSARRIYRSAGFV